MNMHLKIEGLENERREYITYNHYAIWFTETVTRMRVYFCINYAVGTCLSVDVFVTTFQWLIGIAMESQPITVHRTRLLLTSHRKVQ